MTSAKPGGLGKAGTWVREGLTVLLICYIALVAFDAALYRFGGSLPGVNPQIRDLLYSFDVFDMKSHPLYREWLKAFVFDPEEDGVAKYSLDTYKAYDLKAPHAPALTFGPIDALGWPNATPIKDAKVLFIGDSFTYGAGSGTRDCIYSAYSRLTGLPVYGAARGGYGLPHYPLILSRLTSPDQPADQRFTGKKAIVVYYNGNDALADTIIYNKRLELEHETSARHLTLTASRRLYDFLRDSKHNARQAAPSPKNASSLADAKAGQAQAQETQAQAQSPDSKGFSNWRDIQLLVPTMASAGEPFTLHPFYSAELDVKAMLAVYGADIRANLDALAASGRQSGVEVQVALMPTALQVLAPFLDKSRIEPGSLFARQLATALSAFDLLQDFVENECKARGLATLDLREPLRQAKDPGMLFWPWDTHLTPYGNEVAAGAIAARFGQP